METPAGKRRAEIHSGVLPELVRRKPVGKRSWFVEYHKAKIISSTYIKLKIEEESSWMIVYSETQWANLQQGSPY